MCLKDHKTHVDSKCTSDDFRHPTLTMSELLSRPQDLALSLLETALQSSLIKRSMGSGETNTLQVKTGGQVSQEHTLVCNTNITSSSLVAVTASDLQATQGSQSYWGWNLNVKLADVL